jgi:hypothetical protein
MARRMPTATTERRHCNDVVCIDEAIWCLAFLALLRRLGGAPALFPQVDTIDFFNGRTPPLDVKSDTPTWGNSLGGTPWEIPQLQ